MDGTKKIWENGRKICDGLSEIAKEFGLQDYFYTVGAECSPNFIVCDDEKKPSLDYRTVFCQEMIEQGVLMPYLAPAYEHTDLEITITLEAARKAMKKYQEALNGNVRDHIIGNVIQSVFRKYN